MNPQDKQVKRTQGKVIVSGRNHDHTGNSVEFVRDAGSDAERTAELLKQCGYQVDTRPSTHGCPPLESTDGKWFWAIYEARISIIKASPDHTGFFAVGQDAFWPWSEAKIIACAFPPLERPWNLGNRNPRVESETK